MDGLCYLLKTKPFVTLVNAASPARRKSERVKFCFSLLKIVYSVRFKVFYSVGQLFKAKYVRTDMEILILSEFSCCQCKNRIPFCSLNFKHVHK